MKENICVGIEKYISTFILAINGKSKIRCCFAANRMFNFNTKIKNESPLNRGYSCVQHTILRYILPSGYILVLQTLYSYLNPRLYKAP